MQERENMNIQIVRSINHASTAWGIECMRWVATNWLGMYTKSCPYQ